MLTEYECECDFGLKLVNMDVLRTFTNLFYLLLLSLSVLSYKYPRLSDLFRSYSLNLDLDLSRI